MNQALMLENYGPFKKHKAYRVQLEGRDWVGVRNSGKLIYIDKCMIHNNPHEFYEEQRKRDRKRRAEEAEDAKEESYYEERN